MLFDASGNFVSEKSQREARGTEVAISDSPAAVNTYIISTAAGTFTSEVSIKGKHGGRGKGHH